MGKLIFLFATGVGMGMVLRHVVDCIKRSFLEHRERKLKTQNHRIPS